MRHELLLCIDILSVCFRCTSCSFWMVSTQPNLSSKDVVYLSRCTRSGGSHHFQKTSSSRCIWRYDICLSTSCPLHRGFVRDTGGTAVLLHEPQLHFSGSSISLCYHHALTYLRYSSQSPLVNGILLKLSETFGRGRTTFAQQGHTAACVVHLLVLAF